MKIRLLILLLLYCDIANADDGKEQSVDSQSKKQGETIWLEEKISPTTRWLENLVKPLTVWMEQQINEPEQERDSKEGDQRSDEDGAVKANNTDSNNTLEPASLISAEQASDIAKEHIPGDVLYNKFLSKTNQYRVKLISKLGEIHIIYINAASGEIISPKDKVIIKPVEQTSLDPVKEIVPDKDSQKDFVLDPNDENRTKP